MRLIGLVVGLALTITAFAAEAQQATKIPRVGLIRPGTPPDPYLEAFRRGLHDLGYVERQTVALEYRWAEGRLARLPALAAELVRVKSNVIVAVGGAATQATQRATKTIPIVMSTVIDPVGSRLVASLARPEGNTAETRHRNPHDVIGSVPRTNVQYGGSLHGHSCGASRL